MKKRILLISILLICAFIFVPFQTKFCIINPKTNEILFYEDIEKIKDFHISFIHSANKTEVNEYIKIEKNKLIVYKADFYSYGAGMPEYETEGETIKLENGKIQIENLNRHFDKISMFVGTIANHKLIYKDHELYLSKLVLPGSPIEFEIRKLSAFELIRR